MEANLLHGVVFTITVTARGLAAGFVLAAMQLSRLQLLAALAQVYTIVFRGTPLRRWHQTRHARSRAVRRS